MLLLLGLQVLELLARLERRLVRGGCLHRRWRRLFRDGLVQILGHVALGLVVHRVKVRMVTAVVVVVVVVVQFRVDDVGRIFDWRRRRRGVSSLMRCLLLLLLETTCLSGVTLALLRLALPLWSRD